MWIIAVGAAVLVMVTGLVSVPDAVQVMARIVPVLGFLVAVTVLAELADEAQVFQVAADRAARAARGSVVRLFAVVCLLATASTVLLSLDTTAVLLTPVVLAVAAQLKLPALPFAMATVWLANTASLLLPVSNLSNLLALRHLGLSPGSYAARMAVPAVVAVAVTVLVLGVRYRRQLTGRYELGQRPVIGDRMVFTVAALACLALGPAVLAGVPPWAAAGVGAAVLCVVFAFRRRAVLRVALVPWRLTLLVVGLFVVVTAAGEHGLDAVLAHAVGTSNAGWSVVRTAGVGAGTANVLNNLPAYLALERAVPAGNTEQLLGLLVGVNAGPLVLLWGSLATLLWRERCRARGLDVSAREFAAVGLLGMPLVVVAAAAALAITS